jgi:hypothetical protein
MVLISLGWSGAQNLLKEIHRGIRTHAAKDADDLLGHQPASPVAVTAGAFQRSSGGKT